MTALVFEPFPKIARLKRQCVITEKVDGTNAQIVFDEDGNVLVGSRTRQILPDAIGGKGSDNYGFANWVYTHKDFLFKTLGPGRHYGEWAGSGIQRGYGLKERYFYLFNTSRWPSIPTTDEGLRVVPLLYVGDFTTTVVDTEMRKLKDGGSLVGPGSDPEGVVVYLPAAKTMFKVTFDNDGGKWRGAP